MNTSHWHHLLSAPLASVYAGALTLRTHAYDRYALLSREPLLPVISVGSPQAGGTGKTPLIRFLAENLLDRLPGVAIASRGYRRVSRTMQILEPGIAADWHLHGDEPAMLSHALAQRVWLGIDPNRLESVRMLAKRMPSGSAVLLDDGFQHRRCRRLFDIVTVSASVLSDRLLPRGTLREPLSSLGRAHCILVVGPAHQEEMLRDVSRSLARRYPAAFTAPLVQRPCGWRHRNGRSVSVLPVMHHPVALCGIARPQRFMQMLESLGITCCATLTVRDHHRYTPRDFTGWIPSGCDAVLTTEKDMVKIAQLKLVNCPDIWYLTLETGFTTPSDEHRFLDMLVDALPH